MDRLKVGDENGFLRKSARRGEGKVPFKEMLILIKLNENNENQVNIGGNA